MIGKDAYIDAVEELVEEYLEKHPDATEEQADTFAEDNAWERYQDNLADLIDEANDTRKEYAI